MMNQTDLIKKQAAEDFSKARTKEIFSKIMHFIDPHKNRLLSFDDVRKILKPKTESYKGIQAVPIKLIVGSEGRYQDFNKYFLPKREHLRQRWERIDEARLSDIVLPPIQLYELGGVYFVRDGNHRVSVAKAQGVEMVDAEITSLSTELTISPGMTLEELKKALLAYEKKLFYEKTGFAELTGCYNLDFTIPGRYDVIYSHIEGHKYYLNESKEDEVSFDEALVSWYSNVYAPIVVITTEEKLCALFPERTPSDLYIWIVTYWNTLKTKYGLEYPVQDAARDFSARYGKKRKTPVAVISSFFSGLFRKFFRKK